MKTMILSVMIYEALNSKGAGLGNASISIIEQVITEYESAQEKVQPTRGTCACDDEISPVS